MEMSAWTVNERRFSDLPCSLWMLRGRGEAQLPTNFRH